VAAELAAAVVTPGEEAKLYLSLFQSWAKADDSDPVAVQIAILVVDVV
jgi:hypothetical protein